ncbi:response regulator [Sideroxydans lithotrophicus]|uniref:Two component transcriptional regulator, winged helix family n=1 Tax=Sideroxydans lithotrophicus (strain ES-1) TaxID=580332 RepID=D5CME3_SIDLE|nr:response regulator [Sideroxydans lithotrophicus]ADE12615.1 two component transcriptional regulator, winged helix family [Sideroxydans lithotrophicus ES-1]
MSEPAILLIEDEAQIRRLVRAALEEEGYRVLECGTLKEGLSQLHADNIQLLILDLGLPDGDGIAFIRELRTQFALPVLVLSARSAEGEKIRALDAGADDYLTKPYSTGELLARVRAQLRRAPQEGATVETQFRFGDIEVDLAQRNVTRKGAAVRLTPIEYTLLCAMLAAPGKVLTYRHLLRTVWGNAFVESNHYLRIYVSHLRQKLEDDPAQPEHFLTETGIGYRFQP